MCWPTKPLNWQPDALVAVAAQWEQLLEGGQAQLPSAQHSLPAAHVDFTTAAEMKPLVIKVMQNAYLGGITEVTNGTIKKQLNTYKLANGGWKDADLQDNDPKPGIQPLWWSTLSQALSELRQSGDISNDARAWRTYTLPRNTCRCCPAFRSRDLLLVTGKS